ncbi:MAG: hypothetical protein U0326_03340 [Polyangiales bacterium]
MRVGAAICASAAQRATVSVTSPMPASVTCASSLVIPSTAARTQRSPDCTPDSGTFITDAKTRRSAAPAPKVTPRTASQRQRSRAPSVKLSLAGTSQRVIAPLASTASRRSSSPNEGPRT